jgi:hypothetical protein
MIFQRRVLLSINKNAVRRRKHPARNDRYGFPIPSAHAALAVLRTPLESRPSKWSRTDECTFKGFSMRTDYTGSFGDRPQVSVMD